MNDPGWTGDWQSAYLALCAAVREHRDQRGDERNEADRAPYKLVE